jgi:hypothetical protein
MRIAIDAHAIGRRLTGDEVYLRSLLNAFAAQAEDGEIPAHVSEAGAGASVSPRIRVRRVASNPLVRLGFSLAGRVWRDRPEVLHLQYAALRHFIVERNYSGPARFLIEGDGYRRAVSPSSRSAPRWQAVGAEEFTGRESGLILDF